MRRAKIVCTLGPAVAGRISELVEAGMDVARLNLSHGSYAEHEDRYGEVRRASDSSGRAVGVLVDLQGPKIRLGTFAGGPVELVEGGVFTITVRAVAGDASKEEGAEELVKKAREFSMGLGHGGRIDIAMVNAGRGLAGGLLTSDTKQWAGMFELNVLGAAHLMRRMGEIMVAQGSGDILVLGSVSGHNISPFSGFYGSTKFALAGMAEAFRREVCEKGVRVTTIKPGIVLSEFQGVAGYNQENFYRNVERYGKLLSPEDVARVVGFVVSQPSHVHLNEVIMRPTGQDYP